MNTKIEGSHWGKKEFHIKLLPSLLLVALSDKWCCLMWIKGWHYRKLSGFLIFHPSPEKKNNLLFRRKLSLKYIFVYRMVKKDKTTPRLCYNYLQTNSAYMQSPFQKSVDIHFLSSLCVCTLSCMVHPRYLRHPSLRKSSGSIFNQRPNSSIHTPRISGNWSR